MLNVTRQAGAFGNASVAYRVGGGGPEAQGLLGGRAVGRVLVREGETHTAVSLPISSQVRRQPGEGVMSCLLVTLGSQI